MTDQLRTLYYKLKYQYLQRKATFGPGTLIKCKLVISGPGKVVVGNDCVFAADPWGSDYNTLYTHKPHARIIIGNRVVLRATRFGSHLSIEVEDNAVLENASIYDSDFHNIDASKRDENFNVSDRKVVIGKNSYVGCECLCSKGTILASNVIMLPGSVIGTKTVSDASKICGNPARVLK
jgi:acetyltransferase-like isoleucine patch superfamily enzyme